MMFAYLERTSAIAQTGRTRHLPQHGIVFVCHARFWVAAFDGAGTCWVIWVSRIWVPHLMAVTDVWQSFHSWKLRSSATRLPFTTNTTRNRSLRLRHLPLFLLLAPLPHLNLVPPHPSSILRRQIDCILALAVRTVSQCWIRRQSTPTL